MTALTDTNAERAYLAAAWYSSGRVLEHHELTADDFQHVPHQHIWRALVAMRRDGAPFDDATLPTYLGADFPRTSTALLDVVTCAAIPQSAGWHAATLTALTRRRRLVEAGTRVAQAATSIDDPDDLAEFARAQIDTATQAPGRAPADTWADQLDRALDRWMQPVADAVPTGWRDLDAMLSGGGLRPGHLTVIGARPGAGKSLVATMIAGHAASRGHGVYFASVEMSADELTDRLCAAATGIELAHLTDGRLTVDQLADMQHALERIRSYPLTIDDRVQTIAHLRRGIRDATRKPAGLGLVVVDYLQLLAAPDAGKLPRHEVVGGMSRAIKLLAREHRVPVVLLAQLNRESMRREGRQPAVHDLRESGAVEQDSDEIILLHRDDDDPDLAGQIQLHLAKNRHGPTGYARLRWQPQISRISDTRLQAVR
jgi:replicative DNA helicase